MSNSVRLTNSVPVEIAERLENYAKVNGNISTTQALIALIVHYTPKLREEPPTKPAAQEQQQPKPQNNLTTEEKVELSWLEKQPFQNLDGSEIDRLNFLTMKKRQSQQT